jgi:hypothetical protein
MITTAFFLFVLTAFFWWFERSSWPPRHRVPVRLMSWREHVELIVCGVRRFVPMSIQARVWRGRAVALTQHDDFRGYR